MLKFSISPDYDNPEHITITAKSDLMPSMEVSKLITQEEIKKDGLKIIKFTCQVLESMIKHELKK